LFVVALAGASTETLVGAPSAFATVTPPPVDNPAYAAELEAWLAGDGVYAGEADAWISGRVIAGDGASIAEYFGAAEEAVVSRGWASALVRATPTVLALAVGAYITYRVVEHLRNGHTVTRTYRTPTGVLKGDNSTIIADCLNALTGQSCPFWITPADAEWRVSTRIANPTYTYRLPRQQTQPGLSTETANDPAICAINSDRMKQCYGAYGNPVNVCSNPFFPCTYLDFGSQLAVTASDMAVWDYLKNHVSVGTWSNSPQQVGYHQCGAVLPIGTCNTHIRKATPEQLGRVLQDDGDPHSVSGTATITDVVDQPAGEPNLSASRSLIHNSDSLFTQINTDLETANPTALQIPDCVGIAYLDCVNLLQTAGVLGTITRVDRAESFCPGTCAGLVYQTEPASGTQVLPSGRVTVYADPDSSSVTDQFFFPGIQYPLQSAQTIWDTVATLNPNLAPELFPSPHVVELPEGDGDADTTAEPCGVINATSNNTAVIANRHYIEWSPTANTPIPSDVYMLLNPHTAGGGTAACDVTDVVGPGTGSGSCTCPVALFDFTPVTDQSVGNKFPFAVLTAASGFLSSINVGASTPEYTLALSLFGNSYSLHIDLAYGDEYMRVIRAVMSVCIWIGAFYYFGSRLFGFKAENPTPDGSEGVEVT
jgi:hypothetical protein